MMISGQNVAFVGGRVVAVGRKSVPSAPGHSTKHDPPHTPHITALMPWTRFPPNVRKSLAYDLSHLLVIHYVSVSFQIGRLMAAICARRISREFQETTDWQSSSATK